MADWREGSKSNKSNPNRSEPAKSKSKGSPKRQSDWRGKKAAAENDPQGGHSKKYLSGDDSKPRKNLTILNSLILLLVILVGAFIAYISNLPTQTPVLHMAILQHDDPLWHPNGYAIEDRENFKLSLGESSSNIELIASRDTAAGTKPRPWLDLEDTEFSAAIGNFLEVSRKPGGPGRGGWIFYLSCHGVTNYDGVPYLVAKNSKALSPDAKQAKLVSLESVLKSLADHEMIIRHKRSYKLLVLDFGRMESQWEANRIANTFPAAVQELVNKLSPEIELSNTYILLSNGDGQKSWTDLNRGGTNFGIHFASGLVGEANDTNEKSNDQKVSLAELDSYLKDKVNSWAQQHRNSFQQPKLIDVGDCLPHNQIQLCHVGSAQFEMKPPVIGSGDDPDAKRLADLWEVLEDLGDAGAIRVAPVRFALIEEDLIRAERAAIAGSAYQSSFRQICDNVDNAIKNLARKMAIYDPISRRHLINSQAKLFQLPEVKRDLERQEPYPITSIAAWRQSQIPPYAKGPTLAELQVNQEKIAAESLNPDLKDDEKTKPLKCSDYFAAANHLLDDFEQQRNVTPNNLSLVLDFLITAPNSPVSTDGRGTHVVEVEFLAMIKDFLNTLNSSFEIDPVSYAAIPTRTQLVRLVQCRRRMETIMLQDDQRVFPWLVDDLASADGVRRRAEDHLFALEVDASTGALDPLMNSPTGLSAIESKKERLHEAYQVLDCAQKSAPYLLEWLIHHPLAKDEQQLRLNQLMTVIEKSHVLSAALNPKSLDDLNSPNLANEPLPPKALVDQIAQNYREVVNLLNRKSIDIIEAQGRKLGSDSETLLEISDLMRIRYVAKLTPSMTTYDRNDLRREERNILNQQIGPTNITPKYESPLLSGLSTLSKAPWDLSLGRTGGVADYKVKEISEQPAAAAKELMTDASMSATFANEVLKEVINTTGSLYQPVKDFPNTPSASRTCSFTGSVIDFRSRLETDDTTACMVLYRSARKDGLAWHADRSMEDFWGNIRSVAQPYFNRQARKFLKLVADESSLIGNDQSRLANKRLTDLEKIYHQWIQMDFPSITITENNDLIDQKVVVQIADLKLIPNGLAASELIVDDLAVAVGNRNGVSRKTHSFKTHPSDIARQQQLEQSISADNIAQSTTSQERIRFRGNVVTKDLIVSGTRTKGSIEQIVDIVPFPYENPVINVKGNLLGTGDVIFIIDCSGTMHNKVVQQGQKESEAPTRMDVAKIVLSSTLESMAKTGQFRTLVMAFGNRVGWNPQNKAAMKRRPGAPQQVNNVALVPGNDVMTLVNDELATLYDPDKQPDGKGVSYKNLAADIAKLQYLGETPLYYSIREALTKVNKQNSTQIIVITDGENDQTAQAGDSFLTTGPQIASLLQSDDYNNVQLQIVGFAFGARAKNLESVRQPRADTLEELAWVARHAQAGGDFISVDEQVKLGDRIKELIQTTEEFIVRNLNPNEKRVVTTLPFGKPWFTRTPIESRKPFEILTKDLPEDDQVEIELLGGENLHLTYDSGKRVLVFDEFERPILVQKEVAVTDNVNTKPGVYFAEVLTFPSPVGRILEIPIRLKNKNTTLFTDKPFHLWAEITPSRTNAFNEQDLFEKRYYGDLLLKNGVPFPELVLRLNQWQLSAKYARVHVYLQTESQIEPAASVDLSGLLKGENKFGGANLDAGNFRVETTSSPDQFKYQVVVTVEPSQNKIIPHQVGISPMPLRIQRTYEISGDGNQDLLRITHRFMYATKTRLANSPNPKIEIWTRDQLTEGASSFTFDVQVPK